MSAVAAAEQVFHQLDEMPPDLIVLDLLMPGMNGIEAIHRLKQRLPDVPVVMVSGHGSAREIAECMRRGASDFLRKPFDEDRLRLVLQTALGIGGHRPQIRTGKTAAKIHASQPASTITHGMRLREVA